MESQTEVFFSSVVLQLKKSQAPDNGDVHSGSFQCERVKQDNILPKWENKQTNKHSIVHAFRCLNKDFSVWSVSVKKNKKIYKNKKKSEKKN